MFSSQIWGFYLPALVAIVAFLSIAFLSKKPDREWQYGAYFVLALIIGVQMPYTGWGSWIENTEDVHKVRFVSCFPLFIFIQSAYQLKVKKIKPLLSVPWLYLGTFSSAAITDFMLAKHHFEAFRFAGLGGAGIVDGLVLASVFAALMGVLINRDQPPMNDSNTR